MSSTIFDVAIVGAGPAGATCAWYLARRGIRPLVLEKRAFPRDKLCGDAVCSHAQTHLERMGVLKQILDNDEGWPAAVGGMVSPRGIRYVSDPAEHLDSRPVIAIRRIFMDARIAAAATAAGAELVERYGVANAAFDAEAGLWTLEPDSGGQTYRARALVIADGALSRLARSLGYVDTPPDAVCSRAYIRASTSAFDCDGLVFYPRALLPGYCALFREARDTINFCVYVIPGGPTGLGDLRPVHDRLIREDPHISKAIGPHAEIGPMLGGPLRLGGIARSYGPHLLILGDAAGQIDPLTGEGIQYAMDAAEIAADTLAEALAAGDLSAASLRRYQQRWMRAFGRDFRWSAAIARFYSRHPIFLDAGAATLNRLGPPFLARWAEIMTGARPKTDFLKPTVWLPIMRDLVALKAGMAA
jgi:menaquinone-9 beta-reductase